MVICASFAEADFLRKCCRHDVSKHVKYLFAFFKNAFSNARFALNVSVLNSTIFFSKMIFPQFWHKNAKKLKMIFTYHKDHMKVCEDNILIVIVPKVLYLLTILMARFLKVAKFLGASNLI